ncbi:unnamed protein product [Effrenium voratum]|uniref:Uncharacterized protein n=1 Tax=Effrenium voratum TaxID=2562239 RepID=A0AA36MKP5_9DINO|nr:unnamed protein product [Effrenium voratum]
MTVVLTANIKLREDLEIEWECKNNLTGDPFADGSLPHDASFELFSEKLGKRIAAVIFKGKEGSPRKVNPWELVLDVIPAGSEVILHITGPCYPYNQRYKLTGDPFADGSLPHDASFELFSEKLGKRIAAVIFKGKEGSPRKVNPWELVLDVIPAGSEVILHITGPYYPYNQRYQLARQVYEAYERGAFNPKSEALDLNWREAPVDLGQFELNIQTHIGDSAPAHVREHFLEALQKQVSEGETWNYLNLPLLQNLDPGLKTLKHCWTQTAVEQAAFSAMCPVSVRPPITFYFVKNDRGNNIGIDLPSPDGSWPASMQRNRNLQNSLSLDDLRPRDPSKMAGVRFQQIVRSMESSPELLADQKFQEFNPSDFEPYQLLQLLHVQFRLALGFPALVEEGFNPKLACVLAQMLRLEFDGNRLKDAKDARGSLLLLTLEQKPSESQEELWERVQSKCHSPEDLHKPVKFIVELKAPAKEPKGELSEKAKSDSAKDTELQSSQAEVPAWAPAFGLDVHTPAICRSYIAQHDAAGAEEFDPWAVLKEHVLREGRPENWLQCFTNDMMTLQICTSPFSTVHVQAVGILSQPQGLRVHLDQEPIACLDAKNAAAGLYRGTHASYFSQSFSFRAPIQPGTYMLSVSPTPIECALARFKFFFAWLVVDDAPERLAEVAQEVNSGMLSDELKESIESRRRVFAATSMQAVCGCSMEQLTKRPDFQAQLEESMRRFGAPALKVAVLGTSSEWNKHVLASLMGDSLPAQLLSDPQCCRARYINDPIASQPQLHLRRYGVETQIDGLDSIEAALELADHPGPTDDTEVTIKFNFSAAHQGMEILHLPRITFAICNDTIKSQLTQDMLLAYTSDVVFVTCDQATAVHEFMKWKPQILHPRCIAVLGPPPPGLEAAKATGRVAEEVLASKDGLPHRLGQIIREAEQKARQKSWDPRLWITFQHALYGHVAQSKLLQHQQVQTLHAEVCPLLIFPQRLARLQESQLPNVKVAVLGGSPLKAAWVNTLLEDEFLPESGDELKRSVFISHKPSPRTKVCREAIQEAFKRHVDNRCPYRVELPFERMMLPSMLQRIEVVIAPDMKQSGTHSDLKLDQFYDAEALAALHLSDMIVCIVDSSKPSEFEMMMSIIVPHLETPLNHAQHLYWVEVGDDHLEAHPTNTRALPAFKRFGGGVIQVSRMLRTKSRYHIVRSTTC